MHPYATDSNERLVVPLILAALSIPSAYGLSELLSHLKIQDKLWWVELPSVWGFYLIYWQLFDKWIWTWPILRFIRVVKVPDFSGTWKGQGISSYMENGERKRFDCTINIKQDWTRLVVWLDTNRSRSKSFIGAVLLLSDDGPYPSLSYEYRNKPKAHASLDTMHAHPGMTRLELVNPTQLEGEYYTGRDRQNYGTLHLQKVL